MMKKLLFPLFSIFNLQAADAQTYYWPDPPAVASFNTCDSISLHLTGMFNDGCSYFYLAENNTQVAGNDVYCHITARNNGCDSGWICTMALVPVNGIYSFPPLNASGTFNLHLVIHNKCMGGDNMDSLTVGNYTANGFAANNVLSSNAGANITPGMPVVYQFISNIPTNYTAYWYRNSMLANTAVNSSSWATTLQTQSDTVKVKIVNDSICIADQDQWSNQVILNVTPNGIQEISDHPVSIHFDRDMNTISIFNLQGNEYYEIFSLYGVKITNGRFEKEQEMVKLKNRSEGIYIIRIYNQQQMNTFRF